MRTKTMGHMIAKATLRAHAPPAKNLNPCYLGFGTVHECLNMCKGECGYKPADAPATTRPIRAIAREISRDWGAKVYFGAVPYLRAMLSLDSVDDDYGADSGRSVVLYFLSNATSYRGETARRLKAELKKALDK